MTSRTNLKRSKSFEQLFKRISVINIALSSYSIVSISDYYLTSTQPLTSLMYVLYAAVYITPHWLLRQGFSKFCRKIEKLYSVFLQNFRVKLMRLYQKNVLYVIL